MNQYLIKYLHFFTIIAIVCANTTYAQTISNSANAINIVTTSPKNGETNVSTSPRLSITFNQKISKGKGYVYIYNSYDDVVAELDIRKHNIAINNQTLIINIPTNLSPNEYYHVEIDGGAILGKHSYFKGITSDKEWNFKTISTKVEQTNKWHKRETNPAFYPNPARNSIHLTGQTATQEVQIINLTGKLVIRDASKNSSININSLPKGIYIISFLQTNGERISKKLIKK